jgi:hypothetical protein
MKKKIERWGLKVAIALLIVVISWSMAPSTVKAYVPIDDLITTVDDLQQSGEIYDLKRTEVLTADLEYIGTVIDSGDTDTATQSLNDFILKINDLSGVLMTTDAASQIVNDANTVLAGL